jgi:hypothetical protein
VCRKSHIYLHRYTGRDTGQLGSLSTQHLSDNSLGDNVQSVCALDSRLFDLYIMVDWTTRDAADQSTKDCCWIGRLDYTGHGPEPRACQTRREVEAVLAELFRPLPLACSSGSIFRSATRQIPDWVAASCWRRESKTPRMEPRTASPWPLSVTKIFEVAVSASSQIPCVTQQGIHPADQGTAGNLGASLLSLAGSNPGQETRDLTLPPIVI